LLAGDATAALNAIDRTEATEYATYHLVRAECLYAQHEYDAARRECERTLELSPNSARATILQELIDEMLVLDRWVQPERSALDIPKNVDVTASFPKLERQAAPAPLPSEKPEDDEKEGLVSETLATILVKQGKYAEARKIYIQLSRKHPERDAYFHERIAEMERNLAE
jgi:tetratricopeptide (TPR) repeat protein